jgi:hypothetical protein
LVNDRPIDSAICAWKSDRKLLCSSFFLLKKLSKKRGVSGVYISSKSPKLFKTPDVDCDHFHLNWEISIRNENCYHRVNR